MSRVTSGPGKTPSAPLKWRDEAQDKIVPPAAHRAAKPDVELDEIDSAPAQPIERGVRAETPRGLTPRGGKRVASIKMPALPPPPVVKMPTPIPTLDPRIHELPLGRPTSRHVTAARPQVRASAGPGPTPVGAPPRLPVESILFL